MHQESELTQALFYIVIANLSPVSFIGTTCPVRQVVPSGLGYLDGLIAQEERLHQHDNADPDQDHRSNQ